ncbi:PerC family transcriptional regulator [Pseudomonas protegens]
MSFSSCCSGQGVFEFCEHHCNLCEIACKRWRWVSRYLCYLTHRNREQAHSYRFLCRSQMMRTPQSPVGVSLLAKAVDQAVKKTAPSGAVRLSHFSCYLRASAHDFSSSL